MNRLIAAGIAVIAVLYLLFSSIYVVNPREQAIVTRFGQINDVHTKPGLYFKLPTSLVDNLQIIENRLLRYDIANMTLQVKGGKFYEVDAFLTYKIADARKFREKALGNLDLVEARIGARFDAALRQVYGLREFSAALSAERTDMMRQARDLIRPDMADLGVDIVDVRILRTDLTQEVSAQTYDRMKAERLAEAALLRANGQQAAQSLRAIANRQAIEIVADATKDSEILRGEGDAQRSVVYANAYNVDPEFFEFYRSMQAYRTGLNSAGTTMVLSPDSEFFHYFGDSGKATVPPGAAAAAADNSPPPTVAPVTDSIPAADDDKPTPALDQNDPGNDNTPTAPLDKSGSGSTAAPAAAAPAVTPPQSPAAPAAAAVAPATVAPAATAPAAPATAQPAPAAGK